MGHNTQWNRAGLHNLDRKKKRLRRRGQKEGAWWGDRARARDRERLEREEKTRRRRQAEERSRRKQESLLGRAKSKIRNLFRRKV